MSQPAPRDREEKTMYTYDDYLKKKQEYGFADGEISDADDRLAQANPDAGMSLLGYKNDWKTATNDSARAWAHAGAEDIRKNWGGYSGGESGGSFALTGMPEYDDPYETAIQQQIKRMNREFEYDPATDPNTKYYTDMYRREGQRAMQDTLGAIAGTTGGIPSSYATAAAAQQRNYYAQQLTDKYPELYQQAYDRFLSEYMRAQQTAGMLQGQSDTAYGRYIDQKNMEYQQEQDRAARVQQDFENAYLMRQYEDDLNLRIRELDSAEQQAAKELALAYAQLAQSGQQANAELAYRYAALSQQAKEVVQDYAYKYAALGENARQSDLDREHQAMLALIDEELARDKLNADVINAEWERAVKAAEFGDLGLLADLGIDTSVYQKLLDEQMNPVDEEVGTQTENDDIVGTVAENIMREKTYPSGYELNAATIDDLAKDAPAYKAKAAADKQANKDRYGDKYAKYLNGDTMTKDEMKNLSYALDQWVDAYRKGETITDDARAIVERYNNANTMRELYDQYKAGDRILNAEEKMMKAYVEDAYNRYRLGQDISEAEEDIIYDWTNGKMVKVGKYW